jgi:hypothetical protein
LGGAVDEREPGAGWAGGGDGFEVGWVGHRSEMYLLSNEVSCPLHH